MAGSYLRTLPPKHIAALAAQQCAADAQAARWIERELVRLMRGGTAFAGHQPCIGYNKRTRNPLLIHGGN